MTHDQAEPSNRALAAKWMAPVAATITMLIIALFGWGLHRWYTWPLPEYRDSKILNLTARGHEWEMTYGRSEKCGEIECLLRANESSKSFSRKLVLPAHEFPLRGFVFGDLVYYRTWIDLPKQLRETDESLVFHSFNIWAKNYRIYVNERLIESGSTGQVNAVIPADIVATGKPLFVSIRVDPTGLPYQGISHYGDVAIGPKSKFKAAANRARDAGTSYYLWTLLPRLSFCLLFCFIYLSRPRYLEGFAFVVYSFSAVLSPALKSEYAREVLPQFAQGIEFSTLADIFTQVLFLFFVLTFFRRWTRAGAAIVVTALAGAIVYAFFALTLLPREHFIEVSDFIQNSLRLTVLGFASCVALSSFVTIWKMQIRTYRLYVTGILGLFFALSFAGLILHLSRLGLPFSGTVEATYELIFFFILAASVAIEFTQSVTRQEQFRSELLAQRQEIEKARAAHAIARATQMLAHDVRRPFSLLRVIVRDILGESDPTRIKEAAVRLAPEADRVLTTVDGMLSDVMEVGSNAKPQVEEVSIWEVVETAVRELLIVKMGCEVPIEYRNEGALLVEGHSLKMQRAVMNILDNAVDAMSGAGRIWIVTRKNGDLVELRIGNSGSFVPPAEREAIFDAFYSKGKTGGTGLGLAVVKKVVEDFGGSARCVSDEGKGTEFVLTLRGTTRTDDFDVSKLPQVARQVDVRQPTSSSATTGIEASDEGIKVLLVEDDIFMIEAWERTAARVGLLTFTSPNETLERLSADVSIRNCIDCVVTDYYFANERGFDFSAFIFRLREVLPGVPILLSSSSPGPDAAAVDLVIEKRPHSFEELVALISRSSP